TVGPGVRLGYFTSSPSLLRILRFITEETNQAPSGLSQAIVGQLLHTFEQGGFTRWLRGLGAQYELRRNWAIDTLFEHLHFEKSGSAFVAYKKPDATRGMVTKAELGKSLFSFVPPVGGMFIWFSIHLHHHPLFPHLSHTTSESHAKTVLADRVWNELGEAGVLLRPGELFAIGTPEERVERGEHVVFLRASYSSNSKAGKQASAFGQSVAREVQEGSSKTLNGFKLESECEKAAKILQSFLANPDHPESALNAIPKEVLARAKGFAIFTVFKAGFVWSGKAGSGVVIARLDDGTWSAPSCIATGGVGFGLQIGADISEFVVVLNTPAAVAAFAKGGNVTIGGQLAAAAGPIGVGGAVNTSLINPAPVFTYSKSKGLFAGKDANETFYGQAIPAVDLLSGKVPPPEAASALYETIEAAETVDESGLPQQAYTVPEGSLGGKEGLFDAGAAGH
ncbi:actin cortical patch component Lsb4, partial [Pseudohyphozyma bogoriensis]